VTALVHPIIPEATARIWTQLGLGEIGQVDLRKLAWGQLELGAKLGNVEAVFPRADKSVIERMQLMEQERSAESETKSSAADAPTGETKAQPAQPAATSRAPVVPAPATATPSSSPATGDGAAGKIGIEDFLKVELRVGEVKVAEKVKGADKLLRLEVDIGTEVRQIVAGIAKAYDPEKLVGRKVVIVANLAPRKLRGLESNGMIVAASLGDEGQPVLAGFLEDVPVGAKLK
jgi:methionyl-tRNA synthetase